MRDQNFSLNRKKKKKNVACCEVVGSTSCSYHIVFLKKRMKHNTPHCSRHEA